MLSFLILSDTRAALGFKIPYSICCKAAGDDILGRFRHGGRSPELAVVLQYDVAYIDAASTRALQIRILFHHQDVFFVSDISVGSGLSATVTPHHVTGSPFEPAGSSEYSSFFKGRHSFNSRDLVRPVTICLYKAVLRSQ